MFTKFTQNIHSLDSNIRIVLATLIMLYALVNGSLLAGAISAVIYYSAIKKFCFIYKLFDINKKYSIKNYYLSLLPLYRTSPVFIFDKNDKIVFKNSTAKETLSHINSVKDFVNLDYETIMHQSIREMVMHEHNSKTYQIEIVAIEKESVILAYCTDVTEVIELNDAIEETQRDVIYAMGEIGESRSKETGNHVKRVAKYSKELALLYGLSLEDAEKLQMASPMHDIGKVGIADAILNAPRKLTSEEFEVMKTHAELGFNMLKNSNKPILKAAAIVANEHHEKYDGSGYPRGLKGEKIHIYGRITAIADVFDALGSDRVYKKSWELDRILDLFKEERGKHFDPKLIDLFINNLDNFLKIREQFKD